MKKLLLLLALTACNPPQPETSLVKNYKAKSPVLCIKNNPKYDGLFACRDAVGKLWICNGNEDCMPADYPATLFSPPAAEVINGS